MDENELDAGSLDMYEDSMDMQSGTDSEVNYVSDTASNNNSVDNDTLISDLLINNGISDPNNIKFEEADGSIVNRSWNDLSGAEKANILTSSLDETTQLTNSEYDLVNTIRQSGLSPEEYLDSIANDAASSQQPVQYEVDQISDDELYILDAIDKYGLDISDEQIETLLKNAKADPELYQREISGLRAEYKRRENEILYREQQKADAEAERQYQQYSETILDSIQEMMNDPVVSLNIDDLNDIANFILTRDESGHTEFEKALRDPDQLATAAFWMLKGGDVSRQMARQIKNAYNNGVNSLNRQSTLAFNPKRGAYNDQAGLTSADSLDVV